MSDNLPTGPFEPEVAQAFARVIEPRLAPGEQIADALHQGYALAARRARLLNRAVTPVDAEFAFSLLCFWPIKAEPGPQAQVLYRRLRPVMMSTLTSTDVGKRAIPDDVLRLGYEELHERQADGSLLDMLDVPLDG